MCYNKLLFNAIRAIKEAIYW